MKILLSNDDGYQAEGIQKLFSKLNTIKGAEVFIVAPDREQSATSHALTLHQPLRIEKISSHCYAVNGTPTDAVMLGVHQILKKKPDLVISGINRGANLGEDVHYSGTVSAAMEGGIMGIPSIAFSQIGNGPYYFSDAAKLALTLVKKALKENLPKGVVLNVNIPNLPAKKIKGFAVVNLGKHNYGDIIVEKVDPRGKPYFWIGGNPFEYGKRSGSDCEAVSNSTISITPIKVDLTDYEFMNEMKGWKW